MGNGGPGLSAHRRMPHPGRRGGGPEDLAGTGISPASRRLGLQPLPGPPGGPVNYRPVVPPRQRTADGRLGQGAQRPGRTAGRRFPHLSNNVLYRPADLLTAGDAEIETRLAQQAKALFSLGEKIILYDLTNTYLTGRAHENSLGQRGHSKEKRRDRPLLTLALVLDDDGFPKASRVFPGNVSEPGTLMEMLHALRQEVEPPRTACCRSPPPWCWTPGSPPQPTWPPSGSRFALRGREPQPAPGNSPGRPGGHQRKQRRHHPGEATGLRTARSSSTARVRPGPARKPPYAPACSSGLKKGCRNWPPAWTKPRGCKNYEKILGRLGRLRERYPSSGPIL